jgi:urease accessory protein
MINAWNKNDFDGVNDWNEFFCASRETAELLAETSQMGYSLNQLLMQLQEIDQQKRLQLDKLNPISFPVAFALAVSQWNIPAEDALKAYLWAWLENQVSAAIKGVPLGQVAGQKILTDLGAKLTAVAVHAMQLTDDQLSNYCPAWAIASSRHETQYSRLFRS